MTSETEHDNNYGCVPLSSKEIEALRNLRENPAFQMVGIGNPTLYEDPQEVFAEPLDDDYPKPRPETRQEELDRWRAEEEENTEEE